MGMAESLSNTDPLIWWLDQLLLLCFYGALDWGPLWQHLILAKAEQAEGLTFPRRERRSGNSPRRRRWVTNQPSQRCLNCTLASL